MMYSKTRDQDGSIVGGNKIHTKRTSPSSPPNIVFSKMKKWEACVALNMKIWNDSGRHACSLNFLPVIQQFHVASSRAFRALVERNSY